MMLKAFAKEVLQKDLLIYERAIPTKGGYQWVSLVDGSGYVAWEQREEIIYCFTHFAALIS